MKLLENYGETENPSIPYLGEPPYILYRGENTISVTLLKRASKVCKIYHAAYNETAACTHCPYLMVDGRCTVRKAVVHMAPDIPNFEDPYRWKFNTDLALSDYSHHPNEEELNKAVALTPITVLTRIVRGRNDV